MLRDRWILATLLIALIPGCHEASSSTGGSSSGASGEHSRREAESYPPLGGSPPFVTTCTVGMLSDIVAHIGGDRLRVEALMGPGTDPHLYSATPRDRDRLLESQIVFYAGHHLEGKMVEIFTGSLARKVPTLAVSEQVPPERLRRPAEFGGAVDPHLWFDVSLWSYCAERVRDFLTEIDPDGAAIYRRNSEPYLAELAALDRFARERIAEIPPARRVLVTAHDAFGYLGVAYGIEVVGIQGISTESEAAVSRINELVDRIVAAGIPAVFVESTISEKNIRSLIEGCAARGHRLEIGGSLFSDAMGAAGTPAGTYIGMVHHNVNTIVEALK